MWSLSLDPARVQLDVVYPWLRDCYWSPGVRRDIVEKAFASSLVAGAYRDTDGCQIGVARVVTDGATFAWLCDVFVDADVRHRGIARSMVRALLDDPRTSTVRRWSLGTRDAHPLYRELGFVPVDPAIMMQLLPERSRWSDR
jgi:GNAT superfamily N-acetyltransferase